MNENRSIFDKSFDFFTEIPKHWAGRSINLALSDRGMKALREIGMEQECLDLSSKI